MTANRNFASYSSRDERRVRALIRLKGRRFERECFFAPDTLVNADIFSRQIQQNIASCERFYLFWSRQCRDSEWVAREIELAIQRWSETGQPDGYFHPVVLDGTPLPDEVMSRFHALDLTPVFDQTPPGKVDIRLPNIGEHFVGRSQELDLLDAAWDAPATSAISLLGRGGIGKTALVRHWLAKMAAQRYRGAERVFGWSFHAHGEQRDEGRTRQSFLEVIGHFFGQDLDPTQVSPWDLGQQLADRVQDHRTLLVLDGLDVLQTAPGENGGILQDAAVETLIDALAANSDGLLVLTSRTAIPGLAASVGETVVRARLDSLHDEDSAELMRRLRVVGRTREIHEVVRRAGGDPLSLTLLGHLLREAYAGDARRVHEIEHLSESHEEAERARRVVDSYRNWLEDGVCVSILELLGLFGRPAEPEALEVLRSEPVIEGLTEPLLAASAGRTPEQEWTSSLRRLVRLGLLSRDGGAYTCPPLVREHFGIRLRRSNPVAWREAHERLFRYYERAIPSAASEQGRLRCMYSAIEHGCRAGRVADALHDIYLDQVCQREDYRRRSEVAWGTDLRALFHFFERPWTVPHRTLTSPLDAQVMNMAGYNLYAGGRLADAEAPWRAVLALDQRRENWAAAAIDAVNLAQLQVDLGNLHQAIEHARVSVENADRADDLPLCIETRSLRAHVHHLRGEWREALTWFEDAKRVNREKEPSSDRLVGLAGFRHAELLIEGNAVREASLRAEASIDWAKRNTGGNRLQLAYCRLAAAITQSRSDLGSDRVAWRHNLDRAVTLARESRHQLAIAHVLITSARVLLDAGDPAHNGEIEDRLDQAQRIADRSHARLLQIDVWLARSTAFYQAGEDAHAGDRLERARDACVELRYGRRFPEVKELFRRLERR